MTCPAACRVLVVLVAFALTALLPARASAQGRCSCNSGCHMYPGQCVQPGSSGCEAGFAPFCSTRAESCPRSGWVSCGGECTCVRVTPTDAGTPTTDASTSTTDASTPADRGAPGDATASPDAAWTSMDVSVSSDGSLAVDGRVPTDGPPASDGSTSTDAPASASDAALTDATSPTDDHSPATSDGGTPTGDGGVPATDGGCHCDGGLCAGGVCYREPCIYHPELGFICTTPGTACRLVGGETYCVPLCAGVTCEAGRFCDERSNGTCVADRCASITCPAGAVCFHNQCGRWGGPDGGVFLPDDLDAGLGDGGAMGPPTATATGCGCRAGSREGTGRGGWLPAALLACAAVRRRPRRRTSLRGER